MGLGGCVRPRDAVRVISGGNAVVVVATTVHGLEPGTRYHFRLLVSQGSYPSHGASAAT